MFFFFSTEESNIIRKFLTDLLMSGCEFLNVSNFCAMLRFAMIVIQL
jgi:hypothetical protein